MLRENRLNKTLREAQTESLEMGNYASVLISNSRVNPEYGHLVNYNYIRCPQFARLPSKDDEGNEVFLFESEGLKFAIQGKNIFTLARMINLRRVAEIYMGETQRFDSEDVLVSNIIIEALEMNSN